MKHKHGVALAGAVVIVLGIGWFARAAAQSPAAAAERRSGEAGMREDILPALLAEVKGLRAAMEQMASSNAHAQLLVGRLQLQETRMNGMIRRLDTVRDSLATAERDYDRIRGALKMLEEHKPGAPGGPPQEEIENMIPGTKQEVTAAKASVDRLRAEESQLTQELTAEQARWIDINRRLDELEQSLAKR